MRTPRNQKQEVNFRLPVEKPSLQSDECFGLEWNPQDKACSICADIEYCGIVYTEKVMKPAKAKFETTHVALDATDFSAVNWDIIRRNIKEFENSGAPATWDELLDTIIDFAGNVDRDTVIYYAQRELSVHGLIQNNGYVYCTK